ncbi:MAG: aromatic ring-hydroxylating dioxygenase subunit alpha [Steroidobacteraceae bacterium]
MKKYANNPAAIRALVRDTEVHRDLYISEELFELEMQHFWRNAWIYLGHESQVPKAGDFYTTEIVRQPLIMLRGSDGKLRVLFNRCAHKGAKVVNAVGGNASPALRCPYHGWTFKLDGSLRTVPLKGGYEGTGFDSCESNRGMREVPHVRNYRGFVFIKFSDAGMDFDEYFGEALTSIDNMVDRSPEGRLEIAGGVLRYMHDCNWKMFVENLNDAMHPMVAHESSAGTAKSIWSRQPEGTPMPMVVEQFVPFVNGYDFFEKMGVQIYPNGHSYSGVKFSIHSNYSAVGEYERRMSDAYGEERARKILGEARHNTVYYPSLTIKGAIQAIRVARPIAHDKTLLESWTFRLAGAPAEILERTVTYSRLINAPTSVVGHDDLLCYRAIQRGLESEPLEWISLHRNWSPSERDSIAGVHNGTSEVSMRGQFRAWRQLMLASMEQAS